MVTFFNFQMINKPANTICMFKTKLKQKPLYDAGI